MAVPVANNFSGSCREILSPFDPECTKIAHRHSLAIFIKVLLVFWEFPNLVVLNLVVCNFYAEALFCALFADLRLRSFADLRLRSFARIRAFLRTTAENHDFGALRFGSWAQIKTEVEGSNRIFFRSQWFCNPIGCFSLQRSKSWPLDPTNPGHDRKASFQDPVAIIA